MNLKYIISKVIKKVRIPSIKNSKIEKTAYVCSGANVVASKLGRYSYIGNDCTVVYSDIGSFCSISDNCIIGGASHPMSWVSTSPAFYKGGSVLKKKFSYNDFEYYTKTIIGHDVWIGSNVLVKGGLSIGNGVIIGMGSVVTKDINDYEIWAGNPARFIRMRFENEIVEGLIRSQWWNLDENALMEAAPYMNNVSAFLEYLGQDKL